MKTLKLLFGVLTLAAFAVAQNSPAGPNVRLMSGAAAASTISCDSTSNGAVYTQTVTPSVTSVCQQASTSGAYAWVVAPVTIAANCGSSATCASPTTFATPFRVVTGTIAFSSATTAGVSGIPAFSSATSYACAVSNANAHAYTSGVEITSATAFTIVSGTSNSDTWIYVCSGN